MNNRKNMRFIFHRAMQFGMGFLICFTLLSAQEPEVAVTYQLSNGRFGDQLLCYLHAKWISYRYGIPLLYKPIMYAEEFKLHDMEEYWTQEKEESFESILDQSQTDFTSPPKQSVLYKITFFSEQPDDLKFQFNWPAIPARKFVSGLA